MKPRINISIVDDHPMVVSGLKNMLEPFRHIRVISTFANGDDLLKGLRTKQPDVLLLDILMPGIQGAEVAEMITRLYPAIKILAITSLNAPVHIKSMIRHGCKGYLLKNTDQDILVKAIETVYGDKEFIEPALKEQMLQNMLNFKAKDAPAHSGKVPALTRREKEVLQLIVQEYSNQEISEKLFLSIRTIENHRFNLQQKLAVKNTVGLVKIAIQMGLV
ncbi:MAG TPA: response regulator transcription factor [Edaphocola sp.]|nr:response regulator transcription factor [Edaphocola sp.]